MKRRIVDYFPFYMYGVLSMLLALGYAHNDVPASFQYIVRTLGISGWIIILIFLAGAIVTACVWLDYRIRALALIPLLLYAVTIPHAFYVQANTTQFYTSLITSHFWSCFAFGLIINILVLHDNHIKHQINERLMIEIKDERKRYEAVAGVQK